MPDVSAVAELLVMTTCDASCLCLMASYTGSYGRFRLQFSAASPRAAMFFPSKLYCAYVRNQNQNVFIMCADACNKLLST